MRHFLFVYFFCFSGFCLRFFRLFLCFFQFILFLFKPFNADLDKTYTCCIHRAGHFGRDLVAEMFIGISDPGIKPGNKLGELRNMFKLCSSSREDDTAKQFFLITGVFDLVINMLNDLFHAGLDDTGKIFKADLLGRTAAQAGYCHNFLFLVLPCKCGSEFNFKLLGMFLDDRATFLDVFRDDLTA